jgi:hypothetical protein
VALNRKKGLALKHLEKSPSLTMNRLLSELSAGFTAIGQSMARRCSWAFMIFLVLTLSFGFVGSAMAHSRVALNPTSTSLSQQSFAAFNHPTPVSEKRSNSEDLALSFFWEAWDLEHEAKGLLGLAPVYSSFFPLEDDTALLPHVRAPLFERNSLSERYHSPIFIFLQIFRL